MLFLPTVHLSCSPDTRALFNNLFFLHLLILPLPADNMAGSTQVHRLPQGPAVLSSVTSVSSLQARKTQRPQRSHQEPGDVIWCNLPDIQTKWGQTLPMVKWLMLYRESCAGSEGGSGTLIQNLLRGWPDHSSNRKGGEQKRQSREGGGSLQPRPSSTSLAF